jgi:hypothetical protein
MLDASSAPLQKLHLGNYEAVESWVLCGKPMEDTEEGQQLPNI